MSELKKPDGKTVIPIFYSLDDNYIHILHVALQSLTSQASKDYFYNIHILYDSLNEKNRNSVLKFNSENVEIFFSDVTEFVEGRAKKMHAKYYYSKAIYFRVFIHELFPQYDKAIYLDTDTVLNADISELYNFNVEKNYLGAVVCETVDSNPIFTAYAEKYLGVKMNGYFNSGVLLLNCEALRKANFIDKFFEMLEKYKLEICPDQDYYNLICVGKTKMLPRAWNKIPRPDSTERIEDIKLVHYNLSLKPWRYNKILYEELFWKHAAKTDFYDAIIRSKKRVLKPEVLRDKNRMTALLRMARALAKKGEHSNSLVHEIYNGKAPDRLAVLDRIYEFEKRGLFDMDVEDDPIFDKLDPKRVDFTNKKLSSKIKTAFATYIGRKMYEKMVKSKVIIMREPQGAENLSGFTGGAVVTCNHINMIDNYVILKGIEKGIGKFRFWKVVREGNWSFKGAIGIILRNANTLPISYTNPRLMVECMKATKQLLKNGDKILVYPEQAMWWNYRKPRPLKNGAFMIAAKAHAPIIPCFITLKDSDIIGSDGFPVQEFTLNIMPVIHYDENMSEKENIERMRDENQKSIEELYKKVYGECEARHDTA